MLALCMYIESITSVTTFIPDSDEEEAPEVPPCSFNFSFDEDFPAFKSLPNNNFLADFF